MTFNPETNSVPVRRRLALTISDQLFDIELQIPLYIHERLTSEDWDRVAHEIREETRKYLHAAAREAGPWSDRVKQVRDRVNILCRERIYSRFCNIQQAAGNDAWEVPASLQAHTVH